MLRRPSRRRSISDLRLLLFGGFAALTFWAVGCAGESASDSTPATDSSTSRAQAAPTVQATDQLIIGMASTDIVVGDNRVAFGLIRRAVGAIKDVNVEVQTFYLTGAGREGPKQTLSARFQQWPGGAGGIYVADLAFDRAGDWGLGITASVDGGSSIMGGVKIAVKETSSTPQLGTRAPRSMNRTARDVESLEDLTTDPDPDPDLYQMTVAEAIDEGLPLLIGFATPAFCQTATCGPQVGILKQLKNRHRERLNVIHVEVYENPPEIRQNGIDVARVTPVLAEWGLPSEPWTFVVDSDGRIAAKFEGFVSEDELDSAVTAILE